MKEGLKALHPIQMASFRLTVSGLVFLPIVFFHFKHIKKQDMKWVVLAGFLGSGVPAFLFAFAQTHVSSSIAGALNALTPLFTLIIAYVFTSYVLTWPKIIGVLVGLSGSLILIFIRADGKFDGDFKFALLIVLATLMYGSNINLLKSKLSNYKSLYISTIPLLFISIPGFIIFLLSGGGEVLRNLEGQNLKSIAAVATLAIFGTALGLVLFNRLIQLTNAIFSSSVTYLIPVFAMIFGWLDHEEVRGIQLFGLLLILAGIYLINRRKRIETV